MALSTIPMNTQHPVLGFNREAELDCITINSNEIALELTVFYLENGARIVNTSLNNPKYVLRATPDSSIYRNAQTGAMMPQDDNNPLCIQEYQLFMMMLTQPVKILELAANIALEYEAYGRYDS
jgi:hypothetical protein